MKINLMNLFDGYVRNYHSFRLTVDHGRHSFTMTEIEYFSRLGSMLGLDTYTEDTCNRTYRPMDLTWWGDYRTEDESWHHFVLHLERENHMHKDEETLDKLFAQREYVPENVIGIMSVPNRDRIDELVKIAQEKKIIENSLLIFHTYSLGRKRGYPDEVHAYLLEKNQGMKHKMAFVSEVAGTLFMHFEPRSELIAALEDTKMEPSR